MDVHYPSMTNDELARIVEGFTVHPIIGSTMAEAELRRRGFDGTQVIHYNKASVEKMTGRSVPDGPIVTAYKEQEP